LSELNKHNEEIEELVILAQDGDHDAFAKLYDLLIDPIYRYVYFRVKNDDVEDIVETVFLRMWSGLKKYKKSKKARFSSWVFRIAHNLVVDHYRSSKSTDFDAIPVHLVDTNRMHNPIEHAENGLQKDVLKSVLFRLKPVYRDVLVYKFLNGLSNKEIAKILKKTEGGVRILQMRSLRALKLEFDNLGIDYEV